MARALIRANLEALQREKKAPLVAVGYLTDVQLNAINGQRRLSGYPPIVAEVLFIGRHIHKSRIVEDGYAVDDVLDQIEGGMDAASVVLMPSKMAAMENVIPREDRYGNMVRDRVVFECSTRHPKAELFGVMPKCIRQPQSAAIGSMIQVAMQVNGQSRLAGTGRNLLISKRFRESQEAGIILARAGRATIVVLMSAAAPATGTRARDWTSWRIQKWLFLGLAAIFVAVRCINLTQVCLDGDEIFSVLIASHSSAVLLRVAANDAIHPPLFYFLLKLWLWIGNDSLLWVRLLAVLLGTLRSCRFCCWAASCVFAPSKSTPPWRWPPSTRC